LLGSFFIIIVMMLLLLSLEYKRKYVDEEIEEKKNYKMQEEMIDRHFKQAGNWKRWQYRIDCACCGSS